MTYKSLVQVDHFWYEKEMHRYMLRKKSRKNTFSLVRITNLISAPFENNNIQPCSGNLLALN